MATLFESHYTYTRLFYETKWIFMDRLLPDRIIYCIRIKHIQTVISRRLNNNRTYTYIYMYTKKTCTRYFISILKIKIIQSTLSSIRNTTRSKVFPSPSHYIHHWNISFVLAHISQRVAVRPGRKISLHVARVGERSNRALLPRNGRGELLESGTEGGKMISQ